MKTIVKYAMEKAGFDIGDTDYDEQGNPVAHWIAANRGLGGKDPLSALQRALKDPKLQVELWKPPVMGPEPEAPKLTFWQRLSGVTPRKPRRESIAPSSLAEDNAGYLTQLLAERAEHYKKQGKEPGYYWPAGASWTIRGKPSDFADYQPTSDWGQSTVEEGDDDHFNRFSAYVHENYPNL